MWDISAERTEEGGGGRGGEGARVESGSHSHGYHSITVDKVHTKYNQFQVSSSVLNVLFIVEAS